MKNFVLFFLLIVSAENCIAQLSSYDFSKYQYPDVKRTTFSLSPDLDIIGRSKSQEPPSLILLADIGLSRRSISNSRKRQLYSEVSGDVYLRSGGELLQNETELAGQFSYQFENRYFIKPKRFLEIEFLNSYRSKNSPSQNFNSSNFDLNISPKYGWGRIENITDGWHTMVILEELKKYGYLKRDLAHDEIDSLANEISRLKNYRNPDGRLESIYEFESLLKYLIENNITNEKEYASFAILKDAYDFEGFQQRGQGKSFKAGVIYNNQRYNYTRIGIGNFKYNRYAFIGEYDRQKAISKHFQFDQNYALIAGRLSTSNDGFSTKNQSEYIQARANLNLGFYQSRRTNINFGTYLSYFYENSNNSRSVFGISFNGKYYVSPVMRYSFSGNLNVFNTNKALQLDETNSQFTVGLDYFIR